MKEEVAEMQARVDLLLERLSHSVAEEGQAVVREIHALGEDAFPSLLVNMPITNPKSQSATFALHTAGPKALTYLLGVSRTKDLPAPVHEGCVTGLLQFARYGSYPAFDGIRRIEYECPHRSARLRAMGAVNIIAEEALGRLCGVQPTIPE